MPDTAEFDDLVAELMLERPQIDPVFARELDAKVSAGFPRRRRRFALPRPAFYVGAPALAAAVIAVVVVSGGGSSPDRTFTVTSAGAASGGGGSSAAAAPTTAYDTTQKA